MAGLLTPYATGELVKALKIRAVAAGVHSLPRHRRPGRDVPAQGHRERCRPHRHRHLQLRLGHQPPGHRVDGCRPASGTEFDTGLDLELLQEIGLYFYAVRKKYHQFESEFTAVDTRVQVNQVPGGMISNLANQLKEQGALNRMGEVLAEIPRVREDLGFPPLVTPTSQIVGTQAFFNVLAGERYKTITNEVKLYLQGGYGKAAGHCQREAASPGHRQRRSHRRAPGRPAQARDGPSCVPTSAAWPSPKRTC